MSEPLDLGPGITGLWTSWRPNRSLNPQYEGIADVEKFGMILKHTAPDGTPHDGCVTFDSEAARLVMPKHDKWQVQSWEPLTISPSVRCSCGWHGFIENGKWRDA